MFEFFEKGGLMLLPIVLCSIVALGIIVERFWSLQRNKILPPDLVPQVWRLSREEKLDAMAIRRLKVGSPLGAILAAGLSNSRFGREIMKESIEEVGRQVAHDLERYLTALGTISAITPLLGLLGTVVGMIKVFSAIMSQGVGDPGVLAGGISEALITTAAGLAVAIPSLMFHRYFEGRVDDLVLNMEEESLKLIEMIHGEREDSTL
ncbi:MAG TPA: MotA/TolQ/ExbB proton channel family protein [Methylococcaceae bacterium]|jgi:biopolymer transport protein ExbB|nr:MotA/TolQ/ExbB proton channel family protein [Methylococcaceae bacterium]